LADVRIEEQILNSKNRRFKNINAWQFSAQLY